VERELLARLESSCAAMARDAMLQAAELATALNRASAEIRRQMLGLDTIRVLGRVECGRMRDTNGGLSATIDQLDSFHADIKARLEAIMRLSEVIGTAMTNYLRVELR
jgi:aerotaxis receptor